MLFIYSSDPLQPKYPDFDYMEESKQAMACGFETTTVILEDLIDENVVSALKYVKSSETIQKAIYRGWMLTPEQYEILFKGLQSKNIQLYTTPEQYRTGHFLTEYYPFIKDKTAKTIWVTEDIHNFDRVYEKLLSLSSPSVIIKDFVKSRKHEWFDSFFIPNVEDKENVARVVRNFIERQGNNLVGGLVFRSFIPLEMIAQHEKSGMPLANEYRIFYLDKKPLIVFKYWEDIEYHEEIPLHDFQSIAETIQSPFFTMDIAKTADGNWIVLEMGDGQVSGIPYGYEEVFYSQLKNQLR